MVELSAMSFSFEVIKEIPERLGRAGVISTPHGQIATPAFIPVGTKASVKSLAPEALSDLGAQAVLANAYHLYLQPGSETLDQAGGLGKFMNWNKPTFTDSGGFQVMSLGAGFKKVIDMSLGSLDSDEAMAESKERLAHVDDEGVTFKSHLDGSMHRFTPEISMQVQHQIGADIIFAFDELTTLHNTRNQALFGVLQGAQYEDLRRKAAKDLSEMSSSGISFDGFGIGGALDKASLGQIVSWMSSELPRDKPRHLLGIGEPADLFAGVENGADTFDCVAPSREARTSAVYSENGRFNVSSATYKRDFSPIDKDCSCYTCSNFTRAYLNHLFRAKEMLASTLATIHNLAFTVRLVDRMRQAIQQLGNLRTLRNLIDQGMQSL